LMTQDPNGSPCFTVIIGDLLERWTNGWLRATPHRVPVTDHTRYSIVKFNGVDGDTVVQPLAPFLEETDERGEVRLLPPLYPAVTQDAHIDAMMKAGLDNLQEIDKSSPASFPDASSHRNEKSA